MMNKPRCGLVYNSYASEYDNESENKDIEKELIFLSIQTCSEPDPSLNYEEINCPVQKGLSVQKYQLLKKLGNQ